MLATAPLIGLFLLLHGAGQVAPPAASRSCPKKEEAALLLRLKMGTERVEGDTASALAALSRREQVRAGLRASNASPGPNGLVAHFYAQARQAADARRRELFTRVAEDQFGRMSWNVIGQRGEWAAGLSEGAALYAHHVVSAEVCEGDRSNTAWLKADLDRDGWYRVSTMGEAADHAAWLLVQHADGDPAFQARVLALLAELVASGETSRKNHAYLHDRVAVAQQRPQRFATQGRCAGPGNWEPFPLEDAGGVDARRMEIGLPPLAKYKGDVAKNCR